MSGKNNQLPPENEMNQNKESASERQESLVCLNLSERKIKRLHQSREKSINSDGAIRNYDGKSGFSGFSTRQKLLSISLTALLALGAFGAIDSFSGNKGSRFLSHLAETVGLKEKQVTPYSQINNVQLSKEYIYAGSRMLAIENYQPTPTPTP